MVEQGYYGMAGVFGKKRRGWRMIGHVHTSGWLVACVWLIAAVSSQHATFRLYNDCYPSGTEGTLEVFK